MQVMDLRESREEAICAAADALRSGLLAIFPTETVYGLFFTEKAKADMKTDLFKSRGHC